MRGLLRLNFYAVLPNMKIFSGIMLLLGICVVAAGRKNPALLIGYALLGMTGFPLGAAAGLRREEASRWGRYKLTAPVKRRDIVKSHFLSQLLWFGAGSLFSGAGVGLSAALYGYPFDRNTDIFMLFVVGAGVSLFMGALFFPLFYLGGEGRNEVLLAVSLLGAVGAVLGLSALFNSLFEQMMTDLQVVLGGAAILLCAVLTFGAAFPLAAGIFKRREY